jgi:hypothetical protein
VENHQLKTFLFTNHAYALLFQAISLLSNLGQFSLQQYVIQLIFHLLSQGFDVIIATSRLHSDG